MSKIDSIVSQLTLEEKAGLCSGLDFWHTKEVKRLGVPSVMMSDGPHGLRKQEEGADHLGIHDSIKAVCFPAACATACSFDRSLLRSMGETLGAECAAERVAVLLGPAVNIKRSPLGGRNFEYFSEDPYLTGELACAFTQGVESTGTAVSVKHFAANNQETRRMSVSAEVSERALREIYLPAFEKIVKDARPKTVMCSYNRINGVYASENRALLTRILREEWGFNGFVVSDWYAVSDRVRALEAGLDLEMPGGDAANDAKLVAAVREGRLAEAELDKAVGNILRVVYAYAESKKPAAFDRAKDHAKAVEIVCESAVLLKNEGVLPLKAGEKVLFVGEFAVRPRYQGGGSSHINAYSAEGAFRFAGPKGARYVKGFGADGSGTEEELREALAAAKECDKAVVFAGLPDSWESEGYDRKEMRLPEAQTRLIAALAAEKVPLAVVLHNGSPVEMPWLKSAAALVEMYLGGEGVGEACVKILYGEVCPSGRLAETFPLRLEDNPSYLNFPGDRAKVEYAEGVFVGYRYYDSKRQNVLFPFGYGLSYASFAYRDLRLSTDTLTDRDTLTVRVDVENTGSVSGKEVVQLYVSDLTGYAVRPVHELKGFEKVALAPGEKKTVTFQLDKRSFAYYDETRKDWYCPEGEYRVAVCRNAREAVLEASVRVVPTARAKLSVTDDTTVEELFEHPETRAVMQKLLAACRPPKDEGKLGDTDGQMMRAAYLQAPLRTVKRALSLTNEQYGELVARLAQAGGEERA